MQDRLELTVGPVAHGGHCVARHDDMVIFVRHALPGERVIAEITEERRTYLRADAVAVLSPSPDRVVPPCPFAGPDACGGCDLQHVAPDAQREWKAAVVREQLTRLGGLTPQELDTLGVRVTALPGASLGWRSRMRYTVSLDGTAGLLKHRSHEVVKIDHCRIAHPAIQALPVTGQHWPDLDEVEVVASSAGDVTVVGASSAGDVTVAVASSGGDVTVVDASSAGDVTVVGASAMGHARVRERAVGREWTLDSRVFWQVHPAAPDALVGAVLELLAPRPGDHVWDLYGGAGLFAAALAAVVAPEAPAVGPRNAATGGGPGGALPGGALPGGGPGGALPGGALSGGALPGGALPGGPVGGAGGGPGGALMGGVGGKPDRPQGTVTLVESDPRGVAAARENLADLPAVRVLRSRVDRALRHGLPEPDLVVLDPPRSGAGAAVVRGIVAAQPRAVAYVACDPAAFSRDVHTFRTAGWRLAALRAYDAFPMTHHVECVGLLVRGAT